MPSSEHGDQRDRTGHEARVNQQRQEPMPASSESGKDQAAAAGHQGQAAGGPGRSPAAGQGDAVRDMMGGPPPQGDTPDAPATQVAATDQDEEGNTRVRHVGNAVPGKPDGEVDTRS